jgi:hypothetical protein
MAAEDLGRATELDPSRTHLLLLKANAHGARMEYLLDQKSDPISEFEVGTRTLDQYLEQFSDCWYGRVGRASAHYLWARHLIQHKEQLLHVDLKLSACPTIS